MAKEQISASADKPNSGLMAFARETRREIDKVTWPTRKEVTLTTTLIVVFALIAGLFFMLVDTGLGYVVSKILGMS